MGSRMERTIRMSHHPNPLLGLLLCLGLSSSALALPSDAPWLPTLSWTPGVVNPKVTQANIKKTICVRGWTATIRPPMDYTEALKKQQLLEPRYKKDKNPAHYEEDHLISLELGGDPHDPRNLWPQIYAGKCGARVKDKLENQLRKLVCAGKITLADAQRAISTDWIAAYRTYLSKIQCP